MSKVVCRLESIDEAEELDEPGSTNGDNDCQQLWLFECLPIELLLKIFSYLSHYELCRNIAPVCRRWRSYAYNPVLWKKLELSVDLGARCEDTLNNLLKKITMVKHLTLSVTENNWLISTYLVFAITGFREIFYAFQCPFLEFLDSLFPKISSLESLNVDGCILMNDDCMEKFCQLQNLKVLSIAHCHNISDDGIIAFAKGIRCLRSLNIDGIPFITNRSVEFVVRMHSGTLERLYLDGIKLTDLAYISNCNELRTLSISDTSNLNDSFIFNIMKLSNIEVLRLGKGQIFTAYTLKNLFENSEVKRLTHLHLFESNAVDDEVVKSICLRYGRFLHTLDLSGCFNVTDDGLEAIVKSCRALRNLTLAGLENIVGDTLRKIPDVMPFLRRADLSSCTRIDQNVLAEVINRMPNIYIVNSLGEPLQAGSTGPK